MITSPRVFKPFVFAFSLSLCSLCWRRVFFSKFPAGLPRGDSYYWSNRQFDETRGRPRWPPYRCAWNLGRARGKHDSDPDPRGRGYSCIAHKEVPPDRVSFSGGSIRKQGIQCHIFGSSPQLLSRTSSTVHNFRWFRVPSLQTQTYTYAPVLLLWIR